MRSRWLRHPRWAYAVTRRDVRRWVYGRFIYDPQFWWYFYVKYRHVEGIRRYFNASGAIQYRAMRKWQDQQRKLLEDAGLSFRKTTPIGQYYQVPIVLRGSDEG